MANSGFRPLQTQAPATAQAEQDTRAEQQTLARKRLASVAAEAEELRAAISGLRSDIIQYGLRQYESSAAKVIGRIKDALHKASDVVIFRNLGRWTSLQPT